MVRTRLAAMAALVAVVGITPALSAAATERPAALAAPARARLPRSSPPVQAVVKELDGKARAPVLLDSISAARKAGDLLRWALELQSILHDRNGNYLFKLYLALEGRDPARARELAELMSSMPLGLVVPVQAPRTPGRAAPRARTAGKHADQAAASGLAHAGTKPPNTASAAGLRALGGGVWESPAGLRYGPGSAQGNRVRHVLEHAADIPGRAGPHGVFAGGRSSVFKTIDEAYELTRAGGSGVTVVQQGRRTVYTIDMA